MLNAAIKDCPVFGGKVKSFDAAAIQTMKGVRKVVPVDDTHVWLVRQPREAVEGADVVVIGTAQASRWRRILRRFTDNPDIDRYLRTNLDCEVITVERATVRSGHESS